MIGVWWTTPADVVLDAVEDEEQCGGEWIITFDHLAHEFPAEWECAASARTRSAGWDVFLAVLEAFNIRIAQHQFRITDDDGVLYFTGRCTERSLAPLEWARYESGATDIAYADNTGEWRALASCVSHKVRRIGSEGRRDGC